MILFKRFILTFVILCSCQTHNKRRELDLNEVVRVERSNPELFKALTKNGTLIISELYRGGSFSIIEFNHSSPMHFIAGIALLAKKRSFRYFTMLTNFTDDERNLFLISFSDTGPAGEGKILRKHAKVDGLDWVDTMGLEEILDEVFEETER